MLVSFYQEFFIPFFKLCTGKGCVFALKPILSGLSTLGTFQSTEESQCSFSFPVIIKEDSKETSVAENPFVIHLSVKDLCGEIVS